MFADHTWFSYGGFNFVLGDCPNDPEGLYRANSARMKTLQATPDFAKAPAERNADPAMVEKRNAAIRASDKHKAQLALLNASDKHKAHLAILNADPATVEKRNARLAVLRTDPAMVEKRNAAIRASDKHKAHIAALNADPAMMEKRNAHIAALNADPKIQFRKRCAWGVKRGEDCICGRHKV